MRFPRVLLKTLGLREGDRLEVSVNGGRIVSGTPLIKNEAFSPKTVAKLMERLDSSRVSITPSELRKAITKGKRNA